MMGPGAPVPRRVSATLSSGALAADYRAVVSALRRCEPVLHRFDPTPYPADAIKAARIAWGEMMRTEYESSSVFVDLALQMRHIDAPFDVQSAVLRMAHEELRHAELCAGVLETLGMEATIPAPPVLRLATHPDCPIEESVMRNVIYCCCLGETINAARLAKRIAETRDPFIRETLRQLAADERFHAQFGYLYLETLREGSESGRGEKPHGRRAGHRPSRPDGRLGHIPGDDPQRLRTGAGALRYCRRSRLAEPYRRRRATTGGLNRSPARWSGRREPRRARRLTPGVPGHASPASAVGARVSRAAIPRGTAGWACRSRSTTAGAPRA
jgi:hypothetical protein